MADVILGRCGAGGPDPPTAANPAVPPDLDAICLRCLEKRPEDRYPAAGELAAALDGWLSTPTGAETRPEVRVLACCGMDLPADARTRGGVQTYQDLVRRHDHPFRQAVKGVPGALVLDTGEGFLASFPSATEAVRAVLRFRYAVHTADWGGEAVQVRAGVHLGEVTELPGGAPAVDAVRALRALALPGQVLLTRAVFDDARAAVAGLDPEPGRPAPPPLAWRSYGPYLFDGVPEPVAVNEVGIEGVSPLAVPPDTAAARRNVAPAEEEVQGWRPAPGLPIPDREAWRLVEKVGDGGFGEVWRAAQDKTRVTRVFKFCFDPDRLAGLRKEVAFLQITRNELGTGRTSPSSTTGRCGGRASAGSRRTTGWSWSPGWPTPSPPPTTSGSSTATSSRRTS